MKTYYVLWTYIGNHSNLLKIEADSAHAALGKATTNFSEDFRKKGKVYVFDVPPVLIKD